MYIKAETVDDLMRTVIKKLFRHGMRTTATRGEMRELFGVLLEINNPRARLSRTEKRNLLFSAFGELLWYLSNNNSIDFIEYYAPGYGADNSADGVTVHGAYGPRLFNMQGHYDQIENVLHLLTRKSSSRRAVIQLIDAHDVANSDKYKEIPCTCTLQFTIRDGRLLMLTHMRSNDAFVGLPHDVFSFTMLQEILARRLNVELGTYKHAVGSLHLYKPNFQDAKAYLNEGWQATIAMPPMPNGDPWPSINALQYAERELREGRAVDVDALNLLPYWSDLVRLLEIYQLFRSNEREKISAVRSLMSSDVYHPYIEKKQHTRPRARAKTSPVQLYLFR